LPLGADAGDDLAQEARPVLNEPPYLPGRGEGTQELVEQITMAMLEVDKVGPGLGRNASGPDIVPNQLLDVPPSVQT